MNFQEILTALACVFIYMNSLFILAVLLKNNSIVDIGWGIGFILISFSTLYNKLAISNLSIVLLTMVILWGLRLAIYIFIRNFGKGEDYRYLQWRKEWGKTVLIRSYFQVFMLQGSIMVVISSPILLFSIQPTELIIDSFNWVQYVGLILWAFGLSFETIADFQLYQYKSLAINKGKIMKTGLWSLSRHPNYFGEALVWWGIFIFVSNIGWTWISILSPLVMTYLLRRVSGVDLLEKKYRDNLEYQEYVRKTPAFIPYFKLW
ncbi:MAG: DUF1295 domain-containing protein [Bacteroidia bacterium]|nr:DUF1295 domain-containing protein [Bacteroidia bacterium]